MPGMDGFETCRRIKREPSLADTPVIFMTGLTDSDHAVRGFEAGGELVERGGVGDFPAEEGGAVGRVGRDDQALAAVIHAEDAFGAGAVGALQAEQVGGEAGPILQLRGVQPDIAQ